MRISLSRGSAVYSIVMIIVLIGIVQNAVQDGLCSMTTLFILFEVLFVQITLSRGRISYIHANLFISRSNMSYLCESLCLEVE